MSKEEEARYPIGRFAPQPTYTKEEIQQLIDRIESAPQKIEQAVNELTGDQLDTPYRSGGWTVRQVVHHLADSHMNAFIRLKWTLTENTPTIKAYDEKAWAETPDTQLDPTVSIEFLKILHVRWVTLLRMIPHEELLTKSFVHPETGKQVTLARQIATYAWHGDHHLAHILLVANNR